ncbi:MAG: type VI secretion system tip protein VgrG [Polyangiaceae bacterium]|nr:type VI secretion system tip protein VgrG [Polyangiaceae bacterium]
MGLPFKTVPFTQTGVTNTRGGAMLVADLAFQSGEQSLTVREFVVRDAISTLFDISVHACSPNEDLDLEAIVGRPVAFRIGGTSENARRWTGIVLRMKQIGAEEKGLSTYHLSIVPNLWLLSQRRNHRIFQHQSVVEIVGTILSEWGLEPVWRVDRERLAKLEIRVQYGESDLAFVCRLLEEAGISFVMADGGEKGSVPMFVDAPGSAEPRRAYPIVYLPAAPASFDRAYVTNVEISREVRPGKIMLGDTDFRRKSDVRLFGEASSAGLEGRYEQFHYEPGGFVVADGRLSDTPIADQRGVVRTDEKVGKLRAEQRLASARAGRVAMNFHTNVADLSPGTVFSIDRHPRSDLAKTRRLLVIEMSITGTQDRSFSAMGVALFADEPFAPQRKTPKPRIEGVQSAIVVGPRAGATADEIHTDEFGRVRVQFPWDREGTFDERSSCWMRVSQGWAGGGFGIMALPRVGQEVLVGFFEGDPDQPIVVGRVYNNTTRVPYKLPEHKTKSTWKSDSTPGSGGFNEIMFDDARGAELVYVQAERNLDKLVKVDESVTIGRMRSKRVGASETIAIGANRTTTIGAVDATWVGDRHAVTMRQTRGGATLPTGTEMVDGRISVTTGEATITLEGPNITFDAAARILMKAGADIALAAGSHVTVDATVNMTLKSGAKLVVQADDGDVVIQGGPNVQINPEDLRWRRAGKKRAGAARPARGCAKKGAWTGGGGGHGGGGGSWQWAMGRQSPIRNRAARV